MVAVKVRLMMVNIIWLVGLNCILFIFIFSSSSTVSEAVEKPYDFTLRVKKFVRIIRI